MARPSTAVLPSLAVPQPGRSLSRIEIPAQVGHGDPALSQMLRQQTQSIAHRRYGAASALGERIKALRGGTAEQDREAELERQVTEGGYLKNAFTVLRAKSSTLWTQKLEEFEEELHHQEKQLGMKHEQERIALAMDCQPLKRLNPKFSKGLLDMMHKEQQLVSAGKYEEAERQREEVDEIHGAEVAAFHVAIAKRIERREARLRGRQELENKAFARFEHDQRAMIRRRNTAATDLLQLRERNQRQDMVNAHDKEFKDLSARIPKLLVEPRRSYSATGSSFKGTLLCRTLDKESGGASTGQVLAIIEKETKKSGMDMTTTQTWQSDRSGWDA